VRKPSTGTRQERSLSSEENAKPRWPHKLILFNGHLHTQTKESNREHKKGRKKKGNNNGHITTTTTTSNTTTPRQGSRTESEKEEGSNNRRGI